MGGAERFAPTAPLFSALRDRLFEHLIKKGEDRKQFALKPMRKKPPQAELRLTNSGQQALTKLWNAIGSFGFLSAVAVIAGMASEKVAPDTFRLTDLDSHSITLFAIPLLALVLIAEAIVGIAYIRVCKPNDSWSNKVPPIVEGLSESGLRPLVSGIVLFAFLIVPWFGLGAAVVNFFRGSYYYAKTASNGCDPKDMLKDCERVGVRIEALLSRRVRHRQPDEYTLSVRGEQDLHSGYLSEYLSFAIRRRLLLRLSKLPLIVSETTTDKPLMHKPPEREQTRLDRMERWLRNQPVLSVIILAGIILVGIGEVVQSGSEILVTLGLKEEKTLKLAADSAKGEFSRKLTELAWRRIFWTQNYIARLKGKTPSI